MQLRPGVAATRSSFEPKSTSAGPPSTLPGAYPASIANRIDPRLGYDVVFVAEPHGALALESDSGLWARSCPAVERAGLTCRQSLREVPADELPRHGQAHLGVNPTGGDIARLRDLARAA